MSDTNAMAADDTQKGTAKTNPHRNQIHRRSLAQRGFYQFVRWVSRLLVVTLCDFRTAGRSDIPVDKGALILANHQSFLDPVLVGLVFNRRLNYLARKSLFTNRFFAFLISLLDAIEINREGSGLAGLKETIIRLRRNEMVLIFPEGTRSIDGKLQPIKNGFLSVARRSKQPLLPVGIAGASNVLNRQSRLPKRSPVAVVTGQPISVETVESLDDQELVRHVNEQITECFEAACQLINQR
jgi:1-acyl-sn-glycerol-3-phosphate acyltransferase